MKGREEEGGGEKWRGGGEVGGRREREGRTIGSGGKSDEYIYVGRKCMVIE